MTDKHLGMIRCWPGYSTGLKGDDSLITFESDGRFRRVAAAADAELAGASAELCAASFHCDLRMAACTHL